jgi:hypothetical protein
MGRVWQQEVNDQQFASAYAPPTEHVIAIVHAQPATSRALNPALTSTSVWRPPPVEFLGCYRRVGCGCGLSSIALAVPCMGAGSFLTMKDGLYKICYTHRHPQFKSF